MKVIIFAVAAVGVLMISDEALPPVLMYHSISPAYCGAAPFTVTTDSFDRQMRWIHRRGYRGVSMRELFAVPRHALTQRLIGLIFDDGFADFAEFAVPILRRYGFTATVFVVAGELGRYNDWAGEPRKRLMTSAQVRQVSADGIEIGSHALHQFVSLRFQKRTFGSNLPQAVASCMI